RFHDATRSMLVASEIAKTADGYTVTTSAGVTVKYAADKVVKLDYSKGKLTYLADLQPASVKETSTEGVVQHYRRNQNLDGQTTRTDGVANRSGLAVNSTPGLEQAIEGAYLAFKAVVGSDDAVCREGRQTVLNIVGDTSERMTLPFPPKNRKEVRAVAMN